MSRKTRKLIWSVPLVAAFAVVGALALFMALPPNEASAQADQPPGKVGMLTADAYDDGVPQEEIELTWEAPSEGGLASHYRIDISTNGGYTWVAMEDSIRNTRHLHDDLKANQTFHYRVLAVNSIGTSPVSDIANATTTETEVPDRPTNLVAAVGTEDNTNEVADTAGELTVTLTWTPPQDPPGAPILGYVVEYSDDGDRWIELMTVADDGDEQQTASHEMLDAGIEYHYRVAAYNKTMKDADDEDVPNPSFTSGWSETDDAETLKGAMPDAPTNLEPGVSPAVTGVWLYWTPPTNTTAEPNADPMGDPISAYEVEGRPTSRFDDADPPQLQLCSDTDCPFEVIKTDIDRPSGTVINSFQVTARDVNANTEYDDDFKVSVPWAYRIRAINRRANDEANIAAGTDAAAATAQGLITTSKSAVIAVPARDNMSLTRPENLVITRSEPDNEGRTGLIVKWNRAETLPYDTDSQPDTPNQVTYAAAYRIEYSDDGPPDSAYDWKVLDATHAATGTSQQTYTDNHLTNFGESDGTATDNDLHAGQERHYRVFALTNETPASAEMSWPSEQKSGNTAAPLKPERPTNLSVRAGNPAGHTSIDLTWTAPDMPVATNDDLDGSEEGPSVINGYRVQYSDDEGKTWHDLVTDKNGDLMLVEDPKYTDKGLMPGQTRDYRVAAANMVGSRYQYSTWSNSDSAKTTPAPLPNEPGGLVAEAYGATSIKLCWNAQAEQPEAAPVTSYKIDYSPDGKDGTWKDLATVDMMTDDQVHTVYHDTMGLSPKDTRHYRVSAINLQGTSDQSDVAMATTMDAMVPDAPTGVTATADSDMAITVSWTAPADPAGAPVTGYKVMWKMSSAMDYADADMAMVAADMMSHQVTGLTPSMEYAFKVMAMNAKGYGDASDEVMETTQATNTAPMADVATSTESVMAGATSSVNVSSYFSDADSDTLTYSSMSDDTAVATVNATGNPVMITGVTEGTTTIKVYASDGMDGTNAMHTITVTVTAAPVGLQDITDGSISVTNNANGSIDVNWMGGYNADRFIVVAAELNSDPFVYESTMVSDGMARMATVTGLNSGSSYLVIVIAIDNDDDDEGPGQQLAFEYGVLQSVTAN